MEYLKVFVSFAEVIEPLADDERGRLFTAMLVYADTGEVIDLPGNERILWPAAKQQIDREAEFLERKRAAGRMGGEAKASNAKQDLAEPSTSKQSEAKPSHKDKDKDKEKEILSKESKERSPHPSLEEVEEYVREAELTMDPRAFFDHFTSNGWKVGGKAPMKDWRAAARNWARRERPSTKNHTPSAYMNADLEKLEINLEEIGL